MISNEISERLLETWYLYYLNSDETNNEINQSELLANVGVRRK